MQEPRTFHMQVRVPRLPLWAWIVAGVFAYFVVAGAVANQGWEDCAADTVHITDDYDRARFIEVYCDGHPAVIVPGILWPITLPWRVGAALFS